MFRSRKNRFAGRPPRTPAVVVVLAAVFALAAPTADAVLAQVGLLHPKPPAGAGPGETVPAEGSKTGQSAGQASESDATLQFNFHFAPWKDVLEWFAEKADLSLVLDAPPPGTFNYTDRRSYTPARAIDLLNSVLLTKGYTLVRRERMLMLINLADGPVPPDLVQRVSPEELDQRGEFELVSCLFRIEKMTPEEAQQEISQLLGPQGAIVVLPKAKQILVTETAGKLRTIRSVIEAAEKPNALADGKLQTLDLKHVTPEEALAVIRPLVGLAEGQNTASDGSLRLAVDPTGSKLLVTGDPEAVGRVEEILKMVDVPLESENGSGIAVATPQFDTYSIPTADPEIVLQVLQTLLSGQADVRLALDGKTGNLIAMAPPAVHATIRATIDQMERDAKKIEVIPLYVVDPQTAVLYVQRFFGGAEGEKDKNGKNKGKDSDAPVVDADPVAGQLIVRGTGLQIAQIRTLLEKLGETPEAATAAHEGNVRMVPLTGWAARSALDQLQQIWPTIRKNRIRVVRPSSSVRSKRPAASAPTDFLLPGFPNLPGDGAIPGGEPPLNQPATPKSDKAPPAESQPEQPPKKTDKAPEVEPTRPSPPTKEAAAAEAGAAHILFASRRHTLAQADDSAEPPAAAPVADAPKTVPPAPPVSESSGEQTASPPAETAEKTPRQLSRPPADIIVVPGSGGLMIASEDLDALDEFERLLTRFSDSSTAGNREFTVFYLKYAKADAAAGLLREMLDAGTGADAASPLGGPGGAPGGDALGALLSLGGGGDAFTTTGPVSIVPDVRLNALVIQAAPADLELVEQLLEVIDQQTSPESVETVVRARLIPVQYSQAEEIAAVIRDVFAAHMSASSSRRQPTPQEFLQALQRGGDRGGRSGRKTEDEMKMSIGVDTRSNSLVVSAPEPLFQQVKDLVDQLDRPDIESPQAVRVITLKRASPEVVQQALSSIIEGSIQSRSGGAGRPSGAPGGAPRPGGASSSQSLQDQMRRRVEYFRAIQQRLSSGGGPPRPGGGPPPRGR